MKSWLPFLASTLCASLAAAEPPALPATQTQKAAAALVEKHLLKPLKQAESKRSRFSRAAPAPLARRVRVLDAVARTDARGKAFVRFAIDVRPRGSEDASWEEGAMTGCAYLTEQQVFLESADAYLPAASALGEEAEPRADVCQAAPGDGGQAVEATRS